MVQIEYLDTREGLLNQNRESIFLSQNWKKAPFQPNNLSTNA
jgi:hypothetical protein